MTRVLTIIGLAQRTAPLYRQGEVTSLPPPSWQA